MKKYIYCVLCVLLFAPHLSAQTDKTFWFVAPEVTEDNDDRPIYFVVTTYGTPADITISMPANEANFTPISISLNAYTTQKIDLTPYINEIEHIYEAMDGVMGKSDKGILIESTSLITVYYEVLASGNSDIFTLKGRNALGTEFITSFQTDYYNNRTGTTPPYSAFDIVATEDNTEVTIETPKEIFGYPGQSVFTITLDKGETFSGVPAIDPLAPPPNYDPVYDLFGRAADDHLSGVRVTTNNKNIAITIKDDCIRGNTGAYELIGDQTVPLSIVGTEYMIMQGNITALQERIYIVGSQDNDSIWVDGVFETTLNDGETFSYPINNPYTHIRTKYPAYVLHVTGTNTKICGAILPSINTCSGSTRVSFSRSTSETFFLNLMVRTGAEGNFLVNGSPVGWLTAADFSPVPGTTEWLAFRKNLSTSEFPVLAATVIENTSDVFHLGVVNGGGTLGTRYAYFSDYSSFKLNVFNTSSGTQNYRACYGESVQLVASQGTNIEWTPHDYLDDPYSLNPIATPLESTVYIAKASGMCSSVDSATVSVEVSYEIKSKFEVDQTTGCAPLDVEFHEYNNGVKERRWDYGNGTKIIEYTDSLTYDTTFIRTYNNTTDTMVRYQLQLIVLNKNDCVDTLDRLIVVYPEINAGFETDTTIGCHPVQISFTDTSSGNLDTYEWEFGDGGGSINKNTVHTFENIGSADTTYMVSLISTSPFLCTDTAYQPVTVHPYVNVLFAADTVTQCSPFAINIYNSSVGVANYNLDFGDGNDTSMITFYHVLHSFINQDTVIRVDTMTLSGISPQGCLDTFKRAITVYPEINSQFLTPDNEVCDSTRIQFTDASYGHDFSYYWDFGDGNTSVQRNPSHLYRNTGDTDTNYVVSLKLESPYCSDISYDTINVHNIVNASYTFSIEEICTPVIIRFDPSNTTGDSLFWDFDGDNITDSLVVNHDVFFKTFYNNDPANNIIQDIHLITSNYGCADTMSRSVTIWPQVVADIDNVSATEGCSPIDISFDNLSSGANLDYNWDFNDGTTSSDSLPPTHHFDNTSKNNRTYRVSLTVVNPVTKCGSKDSVDITVYPFVQAGFTQEITEVCTPFSVNFVNTSTKITGESYQWDTGDGFMSTLTGFVHEYQNNTADSVINFPVSLRTYNSAQPSCESYYYDTVTVFPTVMAEFAPDNPEGCHPHDVNFSQNSGGFALDYFWEFDDGTSSSLSGPGNTFENFTSANKVFNVKLTVTDAQNCSDDTIVQIITNPFVKASFSYEKEDICTPFNVNFSPSNTSGNRFAWDYEGDGVNDETRNIPDEFSHLYDNSLADSYAIVTPRLITYYDFAPACADTVEAIISVPPKVIASFSPDNLSGCQPFNVDFTNNSTGGVLKHVWSFGDSTGSSVLHPAHTFLNMGPVNKTFPVTLTVYGDNNCPDDTTINVTAYSYIDADFKVNESAKCSPFTPEITNSSNGGISGYDWEFGDGSSSTAQNPVHTYVNTSGDLQNPVIALEVSNAEGCTDSATFLMTVYPQVSPSFDMQVEGCHPFNVNFLNSTQYATVYDWDFGDGSTSADTVPSHTFYNFSRTQDSTYNVVLTARSTYDCKSSVDTLITVHPTPFSNFDINNSLGCPPLAVDFTDRSSGTGLTYSWDFDDGNVSNTTNTNHTFNNPSNNIANFRTTLITTTGFGCTDTSFKNIQVYPEVVASFNADNKQGCSPLTVNFTNLSENQDYAEWDFDDGLSSSLINTNHRFVNSGKTDREYVVTLNSRSAYDCFAETFDTITVYPSPKAEFTADPPYQSFLPEPPDVEITNWSNHLDMWDFEWEFGDGTSSGTSDIVFTKIYNIWGYGENDTIAITMTAINPLHSQCRSEAVHIISIEPPLPLVEINGDGAEGCVPLTVNFTTENKFVNSFSWDFNDGNNSELENPEHVFEEPGIYNVKIKVAGDGGISYDNMKVTVYAKPEIDFEVIPNLVMLPAMNEEPEPVYCYNNVFNGETYLWDFGDGSVSREESPRHVYGSREDIDPPYYYDVKLVSWSKEGCVDSLVLKNAVIVDAAGKIKYPNAFMPSPEGPSGGKYDHGSPDNSIFHPHSEGVIEYHLEIYTRWGEVIFATDDVNIGWDGYYKGKRVNQGVFVWKVWGRYANNKQFVKWGDVTVLHDDSNISHDF